MKNILYLFLVLTIFACSSDSDGNSNTSSVEGRWNLSSSSNNGVEENLNYCDLKTYIELNNDGSGLGYVYYTDTPDNSETCGLDFTFNITFSETSNNVYSMNWEDNEGIVTGTADVNNNILTFNYTDEGEYFESNFTKN